MVSVKVDPSRIVGPVKPMHSVGQGPIGGQGKNMFRSFRYLTEAGCPYSRLHDVGGAFGSNRFVDVPNIFRNFDADENDPSSYDFAFTDALIEALVNAGVEPYYRLGITIENGAEIKAYRTDPPKDFEKWARIAEHIVAHYIDGWADGYRFKITYWEIWNEPDDGHGLRVSQMWNGTAEDYYRFYDVTAKHLKKRFGDRIKVGGYSAICLAAGVWPDNFKEYPTIMYCVDFFHGFMAYVRDHQSPLDFFSWHSYNLPWESIRTAYWVREQLDGYGFGNAESHLNECNPFFEERGTAHHSAAVEALMLGMQKAPLDLLALYDARLTGGAYAALFDPYTFKPFHAYYALVAFDQLYRLGNEVYTECGAENVYVAAASDGTRHAMVISNLSGGDLELQIEGVDLTNARYHVIDDKRLLSWSPKVGMMEKNQVLLIEF
ncbi:MAG: hypothetical protein IK088_01830 [Lachnospiraceae bacterium]|nr:hypothetical protein [Lachnospiraceae bacterium]